MTKKKKKNNRYVKFLTYLFLFLLLAGIGTGWYFYRLILKPNVSLPDNTKEKYIYIKTNTDFNQLIQQLKKEDVLKNISSFEWVSEKMNYKNNVHPGRFLVKNGMNNYDLVKMLRSNANIPVKLLLQEFKTINQMAAYIGNNLEMDSATFLSAIYSHNFLKSNNLSKENVMCFFIPNTYELYWNVSPEDFIKKMGREYYKVWNDKRTAKAKKLNLTPVEVTILASIVQSETNDQEEMPTISGVYLNRLARGMKLEADPTVQFLITDRVAKRIYKKDLEIDSPYNTYKNYGLPPGPIAFSRLATIDAVLNFEEHNYIYFCAKADLSGSHNFATTLEEHNRNAREYQNALNKKNIK